MLKVAGTMAGHAEVVLVGDHIPITVDYAVEVALRREVMWRTGDSRSLLQLWLHRETGCLQQLELVMVDARRARREDGDPEPVAIDHGLPMFDIGAGFVPDPEWTTYTVMDDERSFDLVLYSTVARLVLDPAAPARIVGSDRVSFGLDAGDRLCRIDVTSLAAEDMANLRGYLDRLIEYQGTPAAPCPRRRWWQFGGR